MNKNILFVLGAFLTTLFIVNTNTNTNTNKLISTKSTIANIQLLTKHISIPRQSESVGLKNVKNFVKKQMELLGLQVTEQKFNPIVSNKIYHMSNIIGINNKTTGPYILLGAHIDSHQVSHVNTEATTDSATCVAIILELAKNILALHPKAPIAVVFFDGEEAINGVWTSETSLFGSKYFVNNFNLHLIDKVYIFDLIGGDIGKNKIAGFKDLPYTFNDLSTLAKINKKLFGPNEQIFQSPTEYQAKKSPEDDHQPFVKKNKWVLNLIPYVFPQQHHKPTDNYSNVNWKYVEIFYSVMFDFLTSHVIKK